jgi:hypothetical protein
MKTATETTLLDAPAEAVFAYLADIENLPRWATRFCRRLERHGDRYAVVNNLGTFLFELHTDPETGVIDFHVGPEPAAMAVFPSRVVALPGERSAYVFTMFQAPGQPDALFDSQHASLQEELAVLPREVEG